MSSGFPGFLGAPNRSPNFQIFKTSGNFILPQAQNFIVDVFGAGGSGAGGSTAGSNSSSSGGGGGARNRQFFTKDAIKPGTNIPIVVGAGGAAITSPGSAINGNDGGKSSFGSIAIGFLVEAYGGGGGTNAGAGGGGIASTGNSLGGGEGGQPSIAGHNIASGPNANASSDYGGAHGYSSSSTNGGNAVWGGGGSGNNGGNSGGSLFAGGAGGSFQRPAGASGQYQTGGSNSTPAQNGILHALQGGGGWGGRGATSAGTNGTDGGFPGGGGGGTDGTTSTLSGKGGDGLVVIYWW